MFKVRPIRTCAKFEPVKESEAQIPSVELITELVKVELQELCFYVMVRVQYAPFGIADGNVHPRQNFPDTLFVIRNYGMVGGCHSVLFKSGITAEPVRGHIGVSVRPRLYLARDGGSLKIADDQHLYMPDSFGRTVLSGRRRSGPAAFGHDKDGSLALASTPSLQRTVLLVFRSFGGKEALVHFHIPMKGVKAVAPAHHIAQLMHHFPYGLVTLAAELALYLLCRYGTPGSRQQEHGRKPITHRKMAALHDRARTKLHLMFAIHASPGLMARIPAQAQTAALAAEQTVVFTETTQCSLAGGLVWVLTVKIKQGHIIYVFIVHTSRIKHKVFQYTPIGHLGGLNFANLGTCGHSFNDILDISRMESGRIKFVEEECDVVELCQTALSTAEYARRTQAIYQFQTPVSSLILKTDAQRLKQVLINLLSNAGKFTPSGFIRLAIKVNKEDNCLEFSVTDTGCGIPAGKSERIFERFEKLNEYSQGTGLGLSICKLIVENLGGKIWVDKNYKEGARFVFTHPLNEK